MLVPNWETVSSILLISDYSAFISSSVAAWKVDISLLLCSRRLKMEERRSLQPFVLFITCSRTFDPGFLVAKSRMDFRLSQPFSRSSISVDVRMRPTPWARRFNVEGLSSYCMVAFSRQPPYRDLPSETMISLKAKQIRNLYDDLDHRLCITLERDWSHPWG